MADSDDEIKTHLSFINLDDLKVGDEIPLFGMVTGLSETANKEGYYEMELNETLTVFIDGDKQGQRLVSEEFKKNNPTDLIVVDESCSLLEVIQHRMGETGIFVSTLLEKEPKCKFLCNLVIFGKKQPKFHKFNN